VAACAAGLCCLVSLFGLGESPKNGDRNEVIVAVVNGKPIPFSAIEVPIEVATSAFVHEHERDPNSESDLAEVEKIRQRAESKRLVNYIRGTIREQQLERFGIECSDAELRARWQRLVEERDPPSSRAETRAEMENLLECVRAVHEDGADPDVVFETQLGPGMTREQWQSVLRQYKNPEVRRLMRERLNKDPEKYDDDAKEMARAVLLTEKLRLAVENDLGRSDPEFAEYARLIETDAQNEKVKSKPYNYMEIKRNEWWQKRFGDAKVEILDDRFKHVWKEPFE